MSPLNIAAIVEGDGEVGAVPVLLRRHAELLGWGGRVKIHPIRQPASRLLRPGELERVVELAARKVGIAGGILVLIDCEDQCPARLGPELLGRIRRARDDLPVSMVLAHREFEAWFVGSAESIAGRRDLPSDLRSHPAPESVRGCKEWLSQQMPRGRSYDAFRDQPALAALFDMDQAKQACPSFDKCHREMIVLLEEVDRRVGMGPV